jgi:hypothetical protein
VWWLEPSCVEVIADVTEELHCGRDGAGCKKFCSRVLYNSFLQSLVLEVGLF